MFPARHFGHWLIVITTSWSVPDRVLMIGKIGKRIRRGGTFNPESAKMMGLARRAEAGLIEAGLKHGPSISVLEPGGIQSAGFMVEQWIKIKAEEILRGVKGVKSIDSQIKVSQAVARYG